MLINLRNALMAGKRLPYDAEVEYLESTGTQWIDTGVYGDLDTVAEFRAAATAHDGFYPIFGARRSYYQNALAVYNGSDVGYKYTVSYDSIRPTNLSLVSDVSADVGAWVDFHVGKNMRFGSWQKDTTSYASSFSTLHTLCLFAWNQNGTILCGKYKASYLKIWQNGVLVRDFIPVRKGSTGYLYDRVSGKLFGNAGTGDFVLGPDVVPVEYIESHGTEYIDTGLNSTTDAFCDFEIGFRKTSTSTSTQTGGYCAPYGYRYGTVFRYGIFGGTTSSITNFWAGVDKSASVPMEKDTLWHTVKVVNGGYVDIDGVRTAIGTGSVRANIGLLLFATVSSSSGASSYIVVPSQISYCKIYNTSGVPVRDYKAIRVGTDATTWEGAMMDTLTRRIYRNAGTGAFTYGNDLKYPIPAE